MKNQYTLEQMKLAFETGRNYQLTGENNFNELIQEIDQINLFNHVHDNNVVNIKRTHNDTARKTT